MIFVVVFVFVSAVYTLWFPCDHLRVRVCVFVCIMCVF